MAGPESPPVTAGDLLTTDELLSLRRLSGVRGSLLVLHAWSVIAAAIALCAAWPSWLTTLGAIAVIGGRQLGLAVLMHEAAHWRLFARHRMNDHVGRWLCGNPVWADLKTYRRRHHLHHRHTRQPDDPDLALSAALPVARAAFWLAVARDLAGLTACGRLRRWRGQWRQLAGPIAANAALLGALAAFGQWHLYFVLWLLPLATCYQVLLRIRDVAEHGMVDDDGDPLRNTRTVGAGPLARALVAPYWANYHLEHHLLVFVPCWRLRAAHRLLLAKGCAPGMETAPGYLAVLRRATSG